MPNIKFFYLYRDGANYKKFSNVVFENPNHIELDQLGKFILFKLIDETWFYADEWKLPELFLDTFHFRVDPSWHEFEALEYSAEPSNSPITLSEFIQLVKNTNPNPGAS
jgi:hypothetical protein